MRFEVAVGT
jgi:hypothetical protein